MGILLIKPTDPAATDYDTQLSAYTARLENVRSLISPDITVQVSETDLPDAVLEKDVYLAEAENQVLMDTALTAEQATALIDDANLFPKLLDLIVLRLALLLSTRLPQVTRESLLGNQQTHEPITWETRKRQLVYSYDDALSVFKAAYEELLANDED